MKQRENIVKTMREKLNAIKLRDGRFLITFDESTSMRNHRYRNRRHQLVHLFEYLKKSSYIDQP